MHETFLVSVPKCGKTTYADIDKLWADSFRQKFQPISDEAFSSVDGVDLSLLTPCRSSLKMHELHIILVNYQTLLWKVTSTPYPDIPIPERHGDDGQHLVYNWNEGCILSPELIDILSETPSC